MKKSCCWLTVFLCTILRASYAFQSSIRHEVGLPEHENNNNHRKHQMEQKHHCFSCASFVYLPLWSQLMHHYYPPKNFTDRCWQPDGQIGLVPCNTACFTIVERVDGEDYMADQHGVIRGCVDRLLLFGLDDDLRNLFGEYGRNTVCRQTDRKLLRLFPLSGQTDVVTFCTCNENFCNGSDMLSELSSSPSLQFHVVVFLLSTWLIMLF